MIGLASIALGWAKSNKLATALGIAALALGVALIFSRLHVKVLQAQKATLVEENATKQAAIDRLERLGELQKDRLAKALRVVESRQKEFSKLREDLAKAQIPKECPAAVQWGSEQMNKLMEGAR